MTGNALDHLIRETPGLWRGRSAGSGGQRPEDHTVDSGHDALNQLLPHGGWPLRAVVEINVDAWGNGELQPLLPLMRRLTQDKTRVVMVAPPYQPYAPALIQAGIALPYLVVVNIGDAADDDVANHVAGDTKGRGKTQAKNIWWCAEKLLRHRDCGLVMVWPQRPHAAQVRRLQLAADHAGNLGVMFHRGRSVDTPVGLRLQVARRGQQVDVTLTRSRYGWRQHGTAVLPWAEVPAAGAPVAGAPAAEPITELYP